MNDKMKNKSCGKLTSTGLNSVGTSRQHSTSIRKSGYRTCAGRDLPPLLLEMR